MSFPVQIMGLTYNLHIPPGYTSGYMMQVARLVDSRMRDVAAQRVATVDPTKIAILAALSIGDDLMRQWARPRQGQRPAQKQQQPPAAGEPMREWLGWNPKTKKFDIRLDPETGEPII